MEHICPENRLEEKAKLTVYCIVSPYEKEIYIGKTLAHRLRKAYAEHYGGRVLKTQSLFLKSKELGCLPPMYVLETGHMSHRVAFQYCVAWTKYFLDAGYTQITEDILSEYSENLIESTQEIYDSIKNNPISKVLQPEGGLFPTYNVRKKDSNGKMQVSFALDSDEYTAIKKAADTEGLSMGAYCHRMAVQGQIIRFDSTPWAHFIEEYSHSKNLLRQILYSIYTTQNYFPADLINIQRCIDHLTELTDKSNEECCKLLYAIRRGGR